MKTDFSVKFIINYTYKRILQRQIIYNINSHIVYLINKRIIYYTLEHQIL